MEPNISQECADRALQREQIAALLKAHALEDVEPEPLRAITPHYQQRISECRRIGMHIENRPRYLALSGGKLKKLDGAYRYLPYEPLGRDAGTVTARGWNQNGPFTEEFRLRPSNGD